MRTTTSALGATLIGLTALLAACGGGGGGGNSGPTGIASASAPASPTSPTQTSPDAGPPAQEDPDAAADRRAAELVAQMTLDEKISQVHSGSGCKVTGGASCIPGIPRLNIPDQVPVDDGAGVSVRGKGETGLPNNLALAATWDPVLAYQYADLVGKETRMLGYTESLGGGINLTREPRGGRTYEYLGEDPLLAGILMTERTKATLSHTLVPTIKHFAVNSQETHRYTSSSNVDEKTLRELYLLPFEMVVKGSQPGNVMCGYNLVNGIKACQNAYLLTDVLKNEWGFKGKVQSDWILGLVDGTQGANAGLDEEELGSSNDYAPFLFGTYTQFNQRLKAAVQAGAVPVARLDDMVKRKLRSMIKAGVFDSPPTPVSTVPADQQAIGADFSRQVAEQSMVLLQNAVRSGATSATLPMDPSAATNILVIGGNADRAVMGGGGSGNTPGADPSIVACLRPGTTVGIGVVPACARWFATSPLASIRAAAPGATVNYLDGSDAAAAANAAAASDVAIVFATRYQAEDMDLPNLGLSNATTDPANQSYDQEALIAAVAAKAKRVVVVLEVGAPVTMPWLSSVDSVLVAWYPGPQGGPAIANVLFGKVNPSGKLPITFPNSESDIPQGPISPTSLAFDYTEGLHMGYRWYDAMLKSPLFAFGHGLSYTKFSYSNPIATPDAKGNFTVTFTLTNAGTRAGVETAQVYAGLPESGQPPKRLVGWQKVALQPGESKQITLSLDARRFAVWDTIKHQWELSAGSYSFYVGGSSRSVIPTVATASVAGGSL